MTTQDLLTAFVNGQTSGNASDKRLYIEGDRLYNYATCIAERYAGGFIVNVTKYSPTTSKHQNRLLRLLPVNNTIIVTGLRMGAYRLTDAI